MNKSLNQYLLFLHWMNLNFWMNKKVIHSVPNSKYGLIFVKVRAKHGRFLAKMRALYGQNSSFCDFLHVQSVIELFSKQLNGTLNVRLNHKKRAKSQQKTGAILVIFHKCMYIPARLYLFEQLGHTGFNYQKIDQNQILSWRANHSTIVTKTGYQKVPSFSWNMHQMETQTRNKDFQG